MKYNVIIALNLLIILTISCQQAPTKQPVVSISTTKEAPTICDILLDSILTKPLTHAQANATLQANFILEETNLEYENVNWRAIELKSKTDKRTIALLEANWQDTTNVSRITIYDASIDCKGIHADNLFREIRPFIDSINLNNDPDGILSFTHAKDKRIQVVYELAENSPIYLGIGSLKDVPDDLPVTSIVFMHMIEL
ncbi:hypothetical protein [Chitinophaga skermanii]|nr:hypothetical protein [Chitinophaga skermanii]